MLLRQSRALHLLRKAKGAGMTEIERAFVRGLIVGQTTAHGLNHDSQAYVYALKAAGITLKMVRAVGVSEMDLRLATELLSK